MITEIQGDCFVHVKLLIHVVRATNHREPSPSVQKGEALIPMKRAYTYKLLHDRCISVCVCVCVCLGFYTLVDNCRSPMRDTLLKAEKRTKNRCITRTEFPNLVIQRVCYDSIY